MVKLEARQIAAVLLLVLVVLAGSFVFLRLEGPGVNLTDSIRVTQIALDQVDSGASGSWYLIHLNATNSGEAPWFFDPSLLSITSNASRTFASSAAYNLTTLMERQTIDPSASAEGLVAFLLPAGQSPTSLGYSDATRGVELAVSELPGATSFASRFSLNVKMSLNGNSVDGWTVTSYNGSQQWIRSIIANGVIQNNSLVFFSGQTVRVNLWFEYLKKPADPQTVQFLSVTAENGFQILNPEDIAPIAMTGWGAQSGVVLSLRVPPGPQVGPVSLAVEFAQS
ncbi:MAG TPA: hypothetical protein VFE91_02910 [Nitrososphaerales archaeon]|nr:hypothetical protein [Nitrososphaerales archaeon]